MIEHTELQCVLLTDGGADLVQHEVLGQLGASQQLVDRVLLVRDRADALTHSSQLILAQL